MKGFTRKLISYDDGCSAQHTDAYLEALLLETGDNFTNKASLDAIRLDHDVSALHYVYLVYGKKCFSAKLLGDEFTD
jgi:hypothetical protein